MHLGTTNMAVDPGSVLKISIKKCDHSAEKNLFYVKYIVKYIDYYHGHIDYYDVSNATEV